ncbi:MAG: class I SAM-dependent methyltransferase, partial [Gammaproteobacteria bacterium]|nr:class I SAM-dependent methyltransferase [Gammaproteobacteria bacterium]
DVRQLLDVGGGQGGFAEAFMRQRQGRASLVEMSPAAAAIARNKGIEVFNQPFEQLATEHRYDCISLLDVLEHLVDPAQALRKAHSLLRPDGYLLLSVPNVGHWSVVWDLLQGRFDYLPVGILCETHLRFYTRPSLDSLLRQTGFGVLTWHNQTTGCPEEFDAYLNACHASGLSIDDESLRTYSFHVLAQRQ